MSQYSYFVIMKIYHWSPSYSTWVLFQRNVENSKGSNLSLDSVNSLFKSLHTCMWEICWQSTKTTNLQIFFTYYSVLLFKSHCIYLGLFKQHYWNYYLLHWVTASIGPNKRLIGAKSALTQTIVNSGEFSWLTSTI